MRYSGVSYLSIFFSRKLYALLQCRYLAGHYFPITFKNIKIFIEMFLISYSLVLSFIDVNIIDLR